MKTDLIQNKIEKEFREKVNKDKRIKNAYLLVNSKKAGVDLNIAEGYTAGVPADPQQPNHLASVGKIFTATLIGMLFDKNELDYNDPVLKYIDTELMEGIHIYRGKDYSDEITIRHLLMQTSGLRDVFWPLLKRMMKEPGFRINTREALIWGKENLKPVAPPGKKLHYTDTNYYLLGFIVEKITGKKFHQAMEEMIFEPLSMDGAYMHGFSEAKKLSEYPTAGLFIKNVNLLSIQGVHELDYAGGSVIAPMEDYLKFMKALADGKLLNKDTLERMINDDTAMGFPALGFDYGYSVWKPKIIPLLVPPGYACWGCVGVTGAFMFFHPQSKSYIIGTFNDFAYRGKALQFMVTKIIKNLLKTES